MRILVALVPVLFMTNAHASTFDGWHVGLQLTSDDDTQPARIAAAAHAGGLRLGLVVDAQPFADENHNIDAVAEYRPGETWGLIGGWRTCAITIEDGRQWQQQLLVGVTGALPSLFGDRLRPSLGVELAVTIVRHGEELETDWISLESQRQMIDTVSANMFLRFDYVSAL